MTERRVVPEPIVPVPALDWPDIRGQRVIVGQAGLGWRADLRGDAPIQQGERVYVPVLPEHDWYRAEAEQVEVFAPLIPIERVWVEAAGTFAVDDASGPDVREARPALEIVHIVGSRVVVRSTAPARFERGFRAASAVQVDSNGDPQVLVVPELEWYRWTWTGRTPRTTAVPADRVWVE